MSQDVGWGQWLVNSIFYGEFRKCLQSVEAVLMLVPVLNICYVRISW